MTATECGHATVLVDTKPYRKVSDACWDVSRRLERMDEMGVRMQALSPMPELFGYWLESGADILTRHVNDVIAGMVAQGRGRFVGLGGVPLQDIDAALHELHRVIALGFSGVEIGSNVNGVPIGHTRFHPFFAEAEKLGAAVFVHAVRPVGIDRLVGPAPLQQTLGYPTDIGLAAASVITGNLLAAFPRLRIAFSHGGGTLASLLPRLEQGYDVFPALRDAMTERPATQAARLYVDSLVFEGDMLRRLVAVFGETRVLLGTDYPFNFSDGAPVARIRDNFPDAALQDRLVYSNALAFLALEEPSNV